MPDARADRDGISVVTPTLGRPEEVRQLLVNLTAQTVLPREVVLVDGAGPEDERTRQVARDTGPTLPFSCRYLRHGGGTAVQRNVGIDAVRGDYVAFIDDDVRLEADCLERMLEVFRDDVERRVGGVAAYVTNQFLDPATSRRWRWYRRLKLFTTYEPGRYDFATGYPINRYLRPPHDGLVEIDFMSTSCALWRRGVFDAGLRFAEFFTGYGVLEDAHLALRARRRWRLLEAGRARCVHLRSPRSRVDQRQIGRMSAVNYRYVFVDLVPERTLRQEIRFWRVQLFDLLRFSAALLRRRDRASLGLVFGKLEGMAQALRLPSVKSPDPVAAGNERTP